MKGGTGPVRTQVTELLPCSLSPLHPFSMLFGFCLLYSDADTTRAKTPALYDDRSVTLSSTADHLGHRKSILGLRPDSPMFN